MHQTTFPNGLRLITVPSEGTQAVTVLVLVGAGSRYETLDILGISHFTEHMFFKGAERYTNAKEVSATIDAVGGEFNAFTGKEYAGYYVKLASTHLVTAVDVLSDMLRFASFAPGEIEKERGVILEEFNMYLDTPMYQVGWDFERLIFGDQPLGRDQIGTRELIKNVTHQQFSDYHKQLYVPENTVIAIAGNVDSDAAKLLVETYFGDWEGKKAFSFDPFVEPKTTERLMLQEKKTEQGHLVLGVRGVDSLSPDYYTSKVLSMFLGGMMSSRMFLSVREAQGLCYYISTSTDDYLDTGAISTRAGVELSRVTDAVKAILHEYELVASEPVPEEELSKAKECLKGKIILRLEDSEELAHFHGKQALLYPFHNSLEEVIAKIDAVTVSDISRLAKELFQKDRYHLALIGPFGEKREELERLVRGE